MNEKPEGKKEPLSLYQKIKHLADILGDVKWQKDGVNAHQKYKYVSEAQYKTEHGKAVREVGLIFKFEVLERQFVQNISSSMHLTTIKVLMTYIDPESGQREVYYSYSDGADSGDKGIYKAETGAYKYHVSNNFHVAEYNDPELDTDTKSKSTTKTAGKKGGFKSPADQKQAKEENMKPSELATPKQVIELEALLVKYKSLDSKKEAAFRNANPDLSLLSKKSVEAMIPILEKAVNK